jgi:predicted ester cyclase
VATVERGPHARIAREAIERVCARGDWTRAGELYAEDFVDHVNAMEFRGQAGIRESVSLYRRLFPDLSITVDDQVEEGDRVASRWTLRGTHRGRAVELSGITISRVADGKVVEDWGHSDTLTLLRQLGVRRSLGLAVREWRSLRSR